MSSDHSPLAKIRWVDPLTNDAREFVLTEGATASIGRSSANDIRIAEQHVSRQHCVVRYRDGVFMIHDLKSSNGTFVNDELIAEPYPLFAGDIIRLYVPQLTFMAATTGDLEMAEETGRLIVASLAEGDGSLIITNGPQEGQTVTLQKERVVIGRATSSATWEIAVRDPSVSRPHARLERKDKRWHIYDLGSSNGTTVNNVRVNTKDGYALVDGDTIALGNALLLFRTGWRAPVGRTDSLPTRF